MPATAIAKLSTAQTLLDKIWQQLHRYVSTPGVLEGSEVALKVQIWLVESPYYVALPEDEAKKDD